MHLCLARLHLRVRPTRKLFLLVSCLLFLACLLRVRCGGALHVQRLRCELAFASLRAACVRVTIHLTPCIVFFFAAALQLDERLRWHVGGSRCEETSAAGWCPRSRQPSINVTRALSKAANRMFTLLGTAAAVALQRCGVRCAQYRWRSSSGERMQVHGPWPGRHEHTKLSTVSLCMLQKMPARCMHEPVLLPAISDITTLSDSISDSSIHVST